jgi:hypothetical protein
MQSTESASPPSSSAGALNLAEVNERLPASLSVRRAFGALEIRSSRRNWTLIAFCAPLWVACASAVYVKFAHAQMPMAPFAVFAAGGVAMTGILLNLIVNHTRISVAHGELRICRFPLPWPGRKTLDASKITRLWVSPGTTRVNGKTLPALWLSDGTRKTVSLIDPLPDEEVGAAIERLIEDHLRIDESSPDHGP